MTMEGQQAAYRAAAQTTPTPLAQAGAPSPARQGQGGGEADPVGYPGAAYPNAAGSAGYPGASYPDVVAGPGASGPMTYPAGYAPAPRQDQQAPVAQQQESAGPGLASTWQANLARLEGLADVLAHRGLRARLVTPPGRVPSLHVVNPSASALAEDVYAGLGQDGRWWFWWSWAERIAVGEDLDGAAAMIEHVLAAG